MFKNYDVTLLKSLDGCPSHSCSQVCRLDPESQSDRGLRPLKALRLAKPGRAGPSRRWVWAEVKDTKYNATATFAKDTDTVCRSESDLTTGLCARCHNSGKP
ncbi:Lethal(2) giant larvae protein [Frankliniella fusca]|uniref:Lethal(2) giant larvae protein n=1 Tax=Frankliniella fusca TaxID=407009 RepID=A0AAE1H664_9NEOP|nr:Lethal(2) giant larvae protein [Frankliniella fusca]